MRRRSRAAGRRSTVVLAAFLVLAAAAAVLAGYFLGRLVMQAIFTPAEPAGAPRVPGPPATPPAPVLVRVDVRLPAVNLHRVQLGAFNSSENAAGKARTMQREGVPAQVMGPTGADAFFRVVCGLYTNRDAARRMADSIKRETYEVFVGSMVTPAREFSLEATDQAFLNQLKEAYEFMPTAITRKAVMWDNYQLNRRANLRQESVDMETAVRAHHVALTGLTPPAGLVERHRALLGIYESMLRSAIEFRSLMETGAASHYVNASMFFVESVDKYTAHILR